MNLKLQILLAEKIEIKSEPIVKVDEVEDVAEEIFSNENVAEIVAENVSEEENDNASEDIKTETLDSAKKEDVPVMNVSFFGSDISSLPIKEEEREQPIERKVQKPILSTESKNSGRQQCSWFHQYLAKLAENRQNRRG